MRHPLRVLVLLLIVSPAFAEAPADRIYRGGPIVTVDAQNRVVEGLAVRGDRILAVGEEKAVLAHRGPQTEMVDLAGHALLPGFVDGHGHLSQVGRLAAAVNVASPPVGPIGNIAALQAALRERAEQTPPGTWLLGAGYDDALLAENRHPTRDELDAISTDHPIVVLHVSMHLVSANSAGLAAAGISAETPDPSGGHIRRRAGSDEPNGVLEEAAMLTVLGALPSPTPEQNVQLLQIGLDQYLSAGFTTVQDGATRAAEWAMLRAAAVAERLPVDVIAYPVYPDLEAALAEGAPVGRLRLGGVKLVLDGSPQGKTAWLSEPYRVPPQGQGDDYRGYPWMTDEQARQSIADIYARGLQLLAHANGDAAADQLLDAVEGAVAAHGSGDRRTVLIHAQVLREDQLDRLAALGIVPSFFVSHTYFWGDWHRDSVLGPERAMRISATASAKRRGIRFSLHSDAPVTPPDALRLIRSAAERTTRSGAVLGAAQRIPVADAIRGVTHDAAYAHFEEAQKGSLEPGKLADLVILSQSPLQVETRAITDIRVLETVKEGVTVFRAPTPAP